VDLGIRGHKAIVNGGSSGIGRSTARALAREGVDLFVSARNEERLLRVCEAMALETGARITPIVADHSTAAGREKILTVCPEPDILVGTATPPPYTDDYRAVTMDAGARLSTSLCLHPFSSSRRPSTEWSNADGGGSSIAANAR